MGWLLKKINLIRLYQWRIKTQLPGLGLEAVMRPKICHHNGLVCIGDFARAETVPV